MSAQTKSFIILFGIALVGTYICLAILAKIGVRGKSILPDGYNLFQYNQAAKQVTAVSDNPDMVTTDLSSWKTFTSAEYGFSFKYNPAWKILAPVKKGDYTIFQIDPGKKYYNIKIYVSSKDYYAMGGLPIKEEIIGGAPAQNVDNLLYGIRANNLYYTFDIGVSLSLKPDFVAMVHSVMFQ